MVEAPQGAHRVVYGRGGGKLYSVRSVVELNSCCEELHATFFMNEKPIYKEYMHIGVVCKQSARLQKLQEDFMYTVKM